METYAKMDMDLRKVINFLFWADLRFNQSWNCDTLNNRSDELLKLELWFYSTPSPKFRFISLHFINFRKKIGPKAWHRWILTSRSFWQRLENLLKRKEKLKKIIKCKVETLECTGILWIKSTTLKIISDHF